MNCKSLFPVLAIMLLSACSSNKPKAQDEPTETTAQDSTATNAEPVAEQPTYDLTDALTFGLRGHVWQVEAVDYSTYDDNGELTEGAPNDNTEITFDRWGHVTTDEWTNQYGYDADGKYYRGNHTYTTVVRDKSGRLQKYVDVESKTDTENNLTLTFSHDKNGRLTTIKCNAGGRIWVEKRQYESGNIYPSKATVEFIFTNGTTNTSETTYTYNRFDEQGNWTERTCVVSGQETETDTTSELGANTRITQAITIEKRTITYYE